ncbi:hypothetical protein EDD16DRAFT_1710702 [Pisolithus croceorrhizus]|nr:hypothetical protein EV401DRAFT_2078527 [Pisolithus croceorrhizus]KAI6110705.1 hypothetical protein EDD16DRAFT_1710702 [Pisolithus croceorrhizus]KAI6159820.1 hypothetical protein EDD17DRAFT_1761874 [Pisolithus thermaeus]
MSDSFQDIYAKHLQHTDHGYPLRMPESMSTLPQNYQDGGLQTGDVGTIDRDGQFDVLFNIYKRNDNLLHEPRGVPKNFQPVQQGAIKSSDNAIPPRPIHSRGTERILESNKPSSADYEFDSSAPDGAILTLPHGAESHQLLSPEQFRGVATKNALDWYEFAQKCYGVQYLDRSLYLVTRFHRACSRLLGSLNNPTNAPGKILTRRDLNIYLLEFRFPADHRHSRRYDDSGKINQTVFITGFKIIVSGGYKQHAPISVAHKPSLSQPFHPSDIINRFLLNKNPNAEVAITYDSQWKDTMRAARYGALDLLTPYSSFRRTSPWHILGATLFRFCWLAK